MKFCNVCENMLYISVNRENGNSLTYYCRLCGDKSNSLDADENTFTIDLQIKKNESSFQHIVNKYTKLDPTLPRIYNMKCPNIHCKTNTDDYKEPVEIIYMRYDNENMKYLYICVECDHLWKTDDSK